MADVELRQWARRSLRQGADASQLAQAIVWSLVDSGRPKAESALDVVNFLLRDIMIEGEACEDCGHPQSWHGETPWGAKTCRSPALRVERLKSGKLRLRADKYVCACNLAAAHAQPEGDVNAPDHVDS